MIYIYIEKVDYIDMINPQSNSNVSTTTMSEEPKLIKHKSHPKHTLKEVYKNPKFECKACKTEGQGSRYRCDPCDFNIHPTCGTCPESLLSFTHPKHMLHLTQHSHFSNPKCNLCQDKISGIKYKCKECNYNLHPLCTDLREYLTGHAMHPPHTIRLQSMESKKCVCDVCEDSCKDWRYYCGLCDVHIHVGCLQGTNKGGGTNSHRGALGVGLSVLEVAGGVLEFAAAAGGG